MIQILSILLFSVSSFTYARMSGISGRITYSFQKPIPFAIYLIETVTVSRFIHPDKIKILVPSAEGFNLKQFPE